MIGRGGRGGWGFRLELGMGALKSELGLWVLGAWSSMVGGCRGLHACLALGWLVGLWLSRLVHCTAQSDSVKVFTQ